MMEAAASMGEGGHVGDLGHPLDAPAGEVGPEGVEPAGGRRIGEVQLGLVEDLRATGAALAEIERAAEHGAHS
jgi:hypothetical protein